MAKKYTNKRGLPDPIVKVVTTDDYDKGDCDISVTSLIDAPRIDILKNKHSDELVEDVEDCIYRSLGKVLHKILEEADTDVTERRLYMKVEGLAGKVWTISGAMDTYKVSEGKLVDYKLTTAFQFDGGPNEKFIQQLNSYIELLRYNKYDAKVAEIHGILRDWSVIKAFQNKNYPPCQYMMYPIELWPREKTQEFLKERVTAHQEARAMEEPLMCNEGERWARKTIYAVKKKGMKRAVSGGLYESLEAAEEHAAQDKKFSVEHRPGMSVRCKFYCKSLAPFCKYYKQLTKEK